MRASNWLDIRPEDYAHALFSIADEEDFRELALHLFWLHYEWNPVYRRFVDLLPCDPSSVRDIRDIPALPIEFFKNHRIVLQRKIPEITFRSSGTTQAYPARHHIGSTLLYRRCARKACGQYLVPPEDAHHLALLPGYLERPDSSLVWMIHDFMQIAHDPPESSFFKSDFDALIEQLDRRSAETHKPLILWGVGFGLLDFAAHCRQRGYQLRSNVIVVETGGMKGRRKEWIREALHEQLGADFGVSSVASEYGMTEMMSQAYARESGFFQSPPWMKVLIRDSTDPFTLVPDSSIGGLNIIDLANLYSCPFLATQDLGRKHSDGCFEVLGRFDHSDVRGCSLMMA